MTLRLFPIRPYINPPVFVPSSGLTIALPAGDHDCAECGTVGTWEETTEQERKRSIVRPRGEGWTRVTHGRYLNGRLRMARVPCTVQTWTRTVPAWFSSCHEQECIDGHVTRSDEVCGDCDSCYDHCECFHCESCGRECSDDACSSEGCYLCPRCCECFYCRHCGDTPDPVCGECEYCDDCGCECSDVDDSDDVVSVATYRVGLSAGTRRFGVELEHTGSGQNRSAAALRAGGLEAFSRSYTKSHTDSWKTVSDCSLSSGCEAVSPILCGPDGFQQLSVACAQLLANGADTDGSCGTHVHIECSDLSRSDRSRLVHFYVLNTEHFATLDGRSQHSRQQWCNAPTLSDVEKLVQADKRGEDLHYIGRGAVNLSNLSTYGTIEFRSLAGTLDAGRIERWTRVLFATVNLATSGMLLKSCETFSEFLSELERHDLPVSTADALRSLYGSPSAA